ncbi:MAG: ABC transporter permease [Lachnospiraceae bacterium]|nr:ABC transporter permease [Lachnospiraceae bacterium]
MIRYLVKNNFKLMLRSRWILLVMVLGPVLVIAILSSAFHDLMQSYEGVEEFRAGYRIGEGSVAEDYMEAVKRAGEKAGITFLEYPEGNPKKVMENNDLAAFAEFGGDTYTLYESEDFKVEGITLEYFLTRMMRELSGQALQMTVPGAGDGNGEETVTLPVQNIEFMPAVSAKDYYGIVYIVYFCWCSIICAAGVLASEKKYGIRKKFQVTSLSAFRLYLGKWIPLVLVTTAGMGVPVVLTVVLFDIHWGNAMVSAGLILLSIMAGAAFGLLLYSLSDNLAITIIVLFMTVWFMGFFGGSFETYMFSNWPDSVRNLSPIYHVNRALVETSCMGQSVYTGSSVLYLLVITVVCSAVAAGVDRIKRGRV